ncbi:MAG: acyl carrier protein [Actinomycetota bacterium]|nr:acyl carrier protein [Actinomycetota bacterium]
MTPEARLESIFRSILEDDSLVLTDELTAADVPAWDSVAHINLMFTIESQFGVEFSDEQLNGFKNVGELRRHVTEHAVK